MKQGRDSRAIITAKEALIKVGIPINKEILINVETHMDNETGRGLHHEDQAMEDTSPGCLDMTVTSRKIMGPGTSHSGEWSQEAEQRTKQGL